MSRELRDALGCFATGVTIITTHYQENDIGLTCSSFNAVSLDPAMALWNIQKSSGCLEAFHHSHGYTVSVLSADQSELAMHFTRGSQAERFATIDTLRAPSGRAIVPGCVAWFDCDLHQIIEAGDHDILLSHIREFNRFDGSGLVFERSQFGVVQLQKVA